MLPRLAALSAARFPALVAAALLSLPFPGSARAAGGCGEGNLIASQSAEVKQELARAMEGVPHAEGLIWEAKAPDGNTATLIGTMHLPDPRSAPLLETMQPKIAGADVLVVEADAAAEARLQAKIGTTPGLAFLTDGPSLLTQIGPELWPKLKSEMAVRGVPAVLAAKFRPWYANLVLSIPPCAAALIASGAEGLDKQLMAAAEADGVPIAPLDDVDGLLDVLTAGTDAQQLDDLRLTLRLGLDSDLMLTTMLDSYYAGRTRESWAFWRYLDLGLDGSDMPAVEDSVARLEAELLDGRNRAWIAKLPALIEGRTAVIAVGAAHLSGENGILQLLEERGYSLRRLDG